MTITRPVARTAAAYLREYTTPEAAAHQARLQLQAIEPYWDSNLSAAILCLEHIARAEDDERRARLQTKLLALGAPDTE